MGCGTSQLDHVSPVARPKFDAPGAGSIILARGGGELRASDVGGHGDFVPTKGGSYIIGRKNAGDWEPGSPIQRPDNSESASHFYMYADSSGDVVRLTYSAISIQGRSPHPPNKPNQDSFIALPRLGNSDDVALFGVFDGHGPRGEDAANYCRLNLPDVAIARPNFERSPLDAIAGSFELLHKQFITPQ